MGNKTSVGEENTNLKQQEKAQKTDPKVEVGASLEKLPQAKPLFQHNPSQLAKDQQGRLHPKWSQIVKRSQQKHSQKTTQLIKKITYQTQKIDQQCLKRFSEDQSKLNQCFQTITQPIQKIEKKWQQNIMKLGQTANICLLKGKKEDQCIDEVKKHLHGCLEETLKEMKNIKVDFE